MNMVETNTWTLDLFLLKRVSNCSAPMLSSGWGAWVLWVEGFSPSCTTKPSSRAAVEVVLEGAASNYLLYASEHLSFLFRF